jgi:serine/threonine protein phosphatase 1
MFRALQNRLAKWRPKEFPPPTPDAGFVAVGDIHGRHDLLTRMIGQIGDRPDIKRAVFLGDYIDRGEQSAEVLRYLHHLDCNLENVICLRGNHEEMLLSFLEEPEVYGPAWLSHGGRQTLASYGVPQVSPGSPEDDWIVAGDVLRHQMGEPLIAWLSNLPVFWQSGNIVAVHAGADPNLPFEQQDKDNFVWGHPDFLERPRTDGIWVVHGHTIVDHAISDQGRISLDTGAYATGKLSASLITRGQVELLTT